MLFQYDTITIYNALQKGEGKPFSPKLSEEDVAHIRSSPHFAKTLSLLEQAGKEWVGKPIPAIRYSNFRQYDENGARGETEAEYSNHRYRLNAFAMLSMLYPERDEYLTELENIIWAICDEYTWSAPAHLVPKGTDVRVPKVRYNEKGLIDNSSYAHVHQLDLFACETSFALCEITTLLEERLAPQVVYRARTECYRRVLTPYLDLTGLWKWEKGTNNWSAVCAGSIGMTALYLIADSSVLTPIIQRLLATLDGYMGGLSEDGACVEGPSYWRYGMSFFSGFAETLRRRTDGGINLFAYDKVRKVAEFQQKIYMTQNHVVSFSDSAKEINFRLGLAVFLKNEYDTVKLPDLNYACNVLGAQGGSHRWCTDYRDIYWARHFDFQQDTPDPVRLYLMPVAQQFVASETVKGHTVCFAAKGGHNAQPHNHNDVGSIIYHIDGDSLLIDLGRGKYSREYFQQRYTKVCNSSRGHSVPIIDGEYQKPGAEYACGSFELLEGAGSRRIEIDMEKAYGLPYLSSLHRSLLFEENGKLTVTDTCTAGQPVDFTGRFVTKSKIIMKDGRVFIEGEHARAELVYDPSLVTVSLDAEHMEVHSEEENPQPGNNVFMVDFTVKEKAGQHKVCIQIIPDLDFFGN